MMENVSLENVKNDRFARYLGIRIVEAREGWALVEMAVNEHHLNGVGLVQGGAIFTLADYAFGVASNTGGTVTVGINVNISYFKAPRGKLLRAEASEESTGNRICGYKVHIFDEDGSLVAAMQGMGYRKTAAPAPV